MSIDVDSIDYKINSFLDYWEKHGRDPDELRVFNWQIRTPGCDGDFGCCSKQHDLAPLVDALYELTGREEPPFDSGVVISEHKPGAVQPVLIRDFDEFVDMFGGADGRPTAEQCVAGLERFLGREKPPVLRIVGPEASGDIQAEINHPSVPQRERDAAEKERRDAEQTDPDPDGQAHAVAPPKDGDVPEGA